MTTDDPRWVGTPALRAQVRDSLARELMMRVMLHDLRGSLTAVRGWVELIGMDGHAVPGGLNRSVDGFQKVVERYGLVDWPGRPEPDQPGILGLVERTLGIPCSGLQGPGSMHSLRLIAGLELARPERIELLGDTMDGVSVEILRLHGVSDDAITMGLTPHRDQLFRRLAEPDQLLGVALLREVARGGSGEVRSRTAGTFDLICRV